jgi:hypothetical protein
MRDPRRPVGVLVLNQVSDPISETKWEAMHRQESETALRGKRRRERRRSSGMTCNPNRTIKNMRRGKPRERTATPAATR